MSVRFNFYVYGGGQWFSMAGSKLAVFFNYLNEIKPKILKYIITRIILSLKYFEIIFIPAYLQNFGQQSRQGSIERMTDSYMKHECKKRSPDWFFPCTKRLFYVGITYEWFMSCILCGKWIAQRTEHRFVLTGICVLYVKGKIKITSLFHRLIALEEIADQAIYWNPTSGLQSTLSKTDTFGTGTKCPS